MSDYIDRQAAIDAVSDLPTWYGDAGCLPFGDPQPPMEALLYPEDVVSAIHNLPSVDVNEVMICGYPARHLAFVAAVMAKENIPPEEVASCLRDVGRMVGTIMAEQKEIIEKSWKEWGSV